MTASYLSSNQWPELYGFSIYGSGPSYVIWVKEGSISEAAGIKVGDKIVQIDGQDVSKQSADSIKFMARNSNKNPPPVSVQHVAELIDLYSDSTNGQSSNSPNPFGLYVEGDWPVLVDQVADNSPSFYAGIASGDILVELNGQQVQNCDSVRNLINNTSGKLTLKIIPMSNEYLKTTESFEEARNSIWSTINQNQLNSAPPADLSDQKLKQAREFYKMMNKILPNETKKHKFILNELKKYMETDDAQTFINQLNTVLKTPEQRMLLNYLKPFVPSKQHALFDNRITKISSSLILNANQNGQNNNMVRNRRLQSMSSPPAGLMKKRDDSIIPNGKVRKQSNVQFYDNELEEIRRQQRSKSITPSEDMPTSDNPQSELKSVDEHKNAPSTLLVIEKTENNRSQEPNERNNQEALSEPDEPQNISDAIELNAANQNRVKPKNEAEPKHVDNLGNNPIAKEPIINSKPKETEEQKTAQTQTDPVKEQTQVEQEKSKIADPNLEQKTFKEKVREVLSETDRRQLKRIIKEYMQKKNVDTFIKSINSLLNTTAKRALWNFLLPVIQEDQQYYAKMSIDQNMQKMKTLEDSSSNSTSNWSIISQENASDKMGTDDTLNTSDTEKQSTISNRSRQSLIDKDLVKIDNSEKKKPNEIPKKLAQQMDYMLSPNDKQPIEEAIKSYKKNGDVNELMNKLEKALDTPTKASLWFNIMPLLDDDDQEYAKKKLCSSSLLPYPTDVSPSTKKKGAQIINNNKINIQIPGNDSKPPLASDSRQKKVKKAASLQPIINNKHWVDVSQALPPPKESLTLPVMVINKQRKASNLNQSLPIVIEPKASTVTDSYHLIRRTNFEYQAMIQNTIRKSFVYSNVVKNKSSRNMSLDSHLKSVNLNNELVIPVNYENQKQPNSSQNLNGNQVELNFK